ncbi:MAG: arylsulfatase [Chlorobi bacterium]|nr:arylsulfatase [Chlorobiota bacterium]
MKTIHSFVILIFSFLLISCANHSPVKKYNVILILTDDQGYGDFGFTGNPYIRTPVLDSLASVSTRFTQFYVSPVCAPTRSSLMTGRYSLRTGIYDTYNGGAIMAGSERTMAEVFKANGYVTGIFGKWHLGDNYPCRPVDQGFDEAIVHGAGGIGQVGDPLNYYAFDSAYFNPVLEHNGKPEKFTGYCTDIFTQEAIRFIEENSSKPFFLYLPFNAPHTPLQVPEEYLKIYEGLVFDTSRFEIQGYPFKLSGHQNIAAAKRVYAMITQIDRDIGKLFTALRTLDLENHTIVVFLSDNGPQQVRYTAGLRGRKGQVYEGGIRVPFLLRTPGLIPQDTDISVPAAHIDLLPTLVNLCNLKWPEEPDIDGKDLVPLIRGDSPQWSNRSLFYYWQRGYTEPYRNIAVRKGNFKLVGNTGWNAGPSDFELFDIMADPYERFNLATQQPEKVLELKQLFDNWYRKIIQSENLVRPPGYIVGSRFQDTVVLNRNDAHGEPGIWAQNEIFGYWNIHVRESGVFSFEIHFKDSISRPGKLVMKCGTVQRTLPVSVPAGKTILIPGIRLYAGNQRVECWFNVSGKRILPFYIKVWRN